FVPTPARLAGRRPAVTAGQPVAESRQNQTRRRSGRLGTPRGAEYRVGDSRSPGVAKGMIGMKLRSSLKSLKEKDGSVVVRRRGHTFVVNKRHPRWKARQG